jgi:hypothetical protein
MGVCFPERRAENPQVSALAVLEPKSCNELW